MNIFDNNKPIIIKLTTENIKINDYNVELSNNTCFPNISYGFNYYSFKLEENMKIATNFYKNKQKIYNVTNLFEKTIDYKKETNSGVEHTTIENGINTFIKDIDKNAPKLIGRGFMKLWEMNLYFNLIPKTDGFVSIHLGENKNTFLQSTILYRDFIGKKKNEYYTTTTNNKLTDYYKNINIIKEKNIYNIKSYIDNTTKADFITANTYFELKQLNLREQDSYNLILTEVITALHLQKDNGNFVLRIYESVTIVTIKIIELLKTFYDEIYICKPLSSRSSSPEKFIVCKKFDLKKLTKVSKDLLKIIKNIEDNPHFNVINLLTNNHLSEKTIEFYKKLNIDLFMKQYVGMNNISYFISLENHNGSEYNEFLDKQIIASHSWIDLFLNPKLYPQIDKYVK